MCMQTILSSALTLFKDKISLILLATLILIFGLWFIKKFRKILIMFLQKSKIDAELISFLNSILKIALYIVLVMVILSVLGLQMVVASIFAALSSIFLALAFVFKDTLSNFISGLVLIMNKPIRIGDHIKLGESEGFVTKIEMMFTTLQTDNENQAMVVPNALLITNAFSRSSKYNQIKIEKEVIFEFSEKIIQSQILIFLEKELILNHSISRIPEPKIDLKQENNKFVLKVLVWCKIGNSTEANQHLEKLITKTKNKFNLKFVIS